MWWLVVATALGFDLRGEVRVTPQLHDGTANIVGHDGTVLGQVTADRLGPGHFYEHWVMCDTAPVDAVPFGTSWDMIYLGVLDGWSGMLTFYQLTEPGNTPYMRMELTYDDMPAGWNIALMADDSNEGVVDFEVYEGHQYIPGDLLYGESEPDAFMLRKRDTSGPFITYTDTWLFLDTYQPLTVVGTRLAMDPAALVVVNTQDFLQAYQFEPVEVYTQTTYRVRRLDNAVP